MRQGLYVVALDRPWVETPFPFQGFVIDADRDLQTLQAYCGHVHVDPGWCDPEALAAAIHCAASGIVAERAAHDARQRLPSTRRFHELVAHARAGRDQARRAVDRLMSDVRFGYSIDTRAAREAVTHLVGCVSADASAALWLTNLKNRDEYTSIHCVNVSVLALTYGLHCGLDHDSLVQLGTGALLHDVGKTLTPDEVLNKEGPLTAEEFEVMKRHPEDGYRLLRDGGGASQGVLDIVRLHHERLHGRGYPFGLFGDQVPLTARICGVVDVYDAMTTDRSYREGLAADVALKELFEHESEGLGTELVEDFIRCIGIFPVGSVVELDNGAVGIVVATNEEHRLQPTLLMLRTPDGEPYAKRLLVNLAVDAPTGEHDAAHRIARAHNPADLGIDIRGIVAQEAQAG